MFCSPIFYLWPRKGHYIEQISCLELILDTLSCVHALLHRNYHIAKPYYLHLLVRGPGIVLPESISVKITSLSPLFLFFSKIYPFSLVLSQASTFKTTSVDCSNFAFILVPASAIFLLSLNSHEFCFQLTLIATLNHPFLLNVS